MWAEFLIGLSILMTLLSVSLTAFTGYDHEQSEFNQVTRTFYFNLKRFQLASQYGSNGGGIDKYFFYFYNHSYITNFYSDSFGEVEYTLPDSMVISASPRSFYLMLGTIKGQQEVDRIWITDYKLNRGREYVFSQQTARIRWFEEKF